jgi:hypothetical protein
MELFLGYLGTHVTPPFDSQSQRPLSASGRKQNRTSEVPAHQPIQADAVRSHCDGTRPQLSTSHRPTTVAPSFIQPSPPSPSTFDPLHPQVIMPKEASGSGTNSQVRTGRAGTHSIANMSCVPANRRRAFDPLSPPYNSLSHPPLTSLVPRAASLACRPRHRETRTRRTATVATATATRTLLVRRVRLTTSQPLPNPAAHSVRTPLTSSRSSMILSLLLPNLYRRYMLRP